MKFLVWGLVLVLAVLHQDVWFWDDDRLVAGFVPVVLAWHMGISLAAGITWWLATIFCWPTDLIEETEQAASGSEEAR